MLGCAGTLLPLPVPKWLSPSSWMSLKDMWVDVALGTWLGAGYGSDRDRAMTEKMILRVFASLNGSDSGYLIPAL